MKRLGISLKVFMVIILNDVMDTVAQILMKKGLTDVSAGPVSFDNILQFIALGASSVLVWAGVIIYVFNFLMWIIILFKVDLSIAMPIGSFGYILTPLAAMIFLHESVGPLRWIGIALIILGIHFVAKSEHSPRGVT